MDKELLAKLHDILKLTGDSKKHYCPDWCDGINALDNEFKKTLKHHCVSFYRKGHHPNCSRFPMDRDMLCIHFADVKAATISRKLRTTKYRSHKTFRIWKDVRKTKDVLDIEKRDLSQYDEILKEIKDTPVLSKLYQRVENDFIVRSEDAGRCPFASLQTHNELTAVWFTFLLNYAEYFEIPDVITDVNSFRKVYYKFPKKEIYVVRINLRVNTKLSRLRDAKLIKDIPDILKQLNDKLKGSLIYSLPDEILIVAIPEEVSCIEQTVKEVLGNKTNYYFESKAVKTVMSNKEFLHKYNEIFGIYQDNLYPVLPDEINITADNEASHRAIICDMCQMAPATVVYPQEVYPDNSEIEPVVEYLCKGCLDVRKEADRATNLARWEQEENVSVAFFKITLDMRELIRLLKDMFTDVFKLEKVFDEDLGFSIIKEFLHDYIRFLSVFRDKVLSYEDYGEASNHEVILDNLFCIKIHKDNEIKLLAREYTVILSSNDFFSEMVSFAKKTKRTLPIKLSVATSNVKYPFMEHWQTLANPKNDINIYAIPHTKLEICFEKYECLGEAGIEDKKVSSALHKLADVEERTSNSFLVTVAMLEMRNDLKGLARYLITTKELSINETLAYYKIMKD